jgi:outer membrane protein assembly factor BamB
VVASPALVRCDDCGAGLSLYAAASDGQVYALDPATGGVDWSVDLAQAQGLLATMFSSPTAAVSREADGEHRRVYFGSGFDGFQKGALYCIEDLRKLSDKLPPK